MVAVTLVQQNEKVDYFGVSWIKHTSLPCFDKDTRHGPILTRFYYNNFKQD